MLDHNKLPPQKTLREEKINILCELDKSVPHFLLLSIAASYIEISMQLLG